MRLKSKNYKELQEIYLDEFGLSMNLDEAIEEGEWLIDLILAING